MKFLVTGGAGFIGSAFVRLLFKDPDGSRAVVNLDKLTYAGNLENLATIADDRRYRFVQGDICDASLVNALVAEEKPDVIVHFAAESHRALPNLDVVRKILAAVGKPESLMQTVMDRPGHDRRYALSSEKLMRETDWQAQVSFEDGLRATIEWYQSNAAWTSRVKSGEYQKYYQRNYGGRAVYEPSTRNPGS